jgi:hypothetical protein
MHRGFEAIEYYSQVAKYSKKIGSKAFVFDHTATVSFTSGWTWLVPLQRNLQVSA